MSFVKTKGFKYFKNFIIGAGAAVVLMGALFKLESWEGASQMLIIGLSIEALIFLFLGILGPEPDYYWDKLYPGLSDYNGTMAPIAYNGAKSEDTPSLNAQVVESKLTGMLAELQSMSKSMSSLKALQEVDFSSTKDQIKSMNNFYTKMNEAAANLGDSLEDSKKYKDMLAALNKNLGSLNSVYGNMLNAMANIGKN
jgi:hypothetical protein